MKTNSLLILACIGASVWAWQQNPSFAQSNVIFSLGNLEKGRVWTLVAALFVHANVLHLFGNMLFLFVFGNTLQNTVGPRKLLTIFFTGGLVSFIAGLAFMPHGAGMLGASAAIFALAGCVMLVSPLKFSWLFLAPQGLIAIIYFIYNVVVAYEKSRIPGYDPQVAYVAHIIGFLTGIPFGIALSDHWKRNLLITLLLLGVYLAIVSGAARSFFRSQARRYFHHPSSHRGKSHSMQRVRARSNAPEFQSRAPPQCLHSSAAYFTRLEHCGQTTVDPTQ